MDIIGKYVDLAGKIFRLVILWEEIVEGVVPGVSCPVTESAAHTKTVLNVPLPEVVRFGNRLMVSSSHSFLSNRSSEYHKRQAI